MTAFDSINKKIIKSSGHVPGWLYILLVAVLFNLLPIIVFKPAALKTETQETNRRFTVMTNTPVSEKNDPYGLYYWLKNCDPAMFSKPDPRTGYAAYSSRNDFRMSHIGDTTAAEPEIFRKSLPAEETPETLPPRPLESFPDSAMPEPRPLQARPLPPVPSAVFSCNGTPFMRRPLPPLRDGTKIPENSAAFELSSSGGGELPVFAMRVKTSGARELDMFAEREINAYFKTKENRAKLSTIRYIVVDWVIPPEQTETPSAAGEEKKAEK